MTTIDSLDTVLAYFFDNVPQRLTISKVSQHISNDERRISLSEIIAHLVEDKYLFQELVDNSSQPSNIRYGISIKGILFFENAKEYRRPYYALEKENKSQKSRDEILKDNQIQNTTSELFVKKYWWVMLIVGWIGGCWTDMAKEGIKRQFWPSPEINSRTENVNKADTLKTRPPKL